MLKFKSKRKSRFPKFSILVWLITLLAIILSSYYKERFNLNLIFAINPSQLNQSWEQLLRLISALFLHGSWQHWAGNMILYIIIALPLERKVGGFWFVLIYLIAGFAGNLYSVLQLSSSTHYIVKPDLIISH